MRTKRMTAFARPARKRSAAPVSRVKSASKISQASESSASLAVPKRRYAAVLKTSRAKRTPLNPVVTTLRGGGVRGSGLAIALRRERAHDHGGTGREKPDELRRPDRIRAAEEFQQDPGSKARHDSR